MPRCASCSTDYSPDLEICPGCGSGQESVRCERCGEDFTGADACPACGKASASFSCDDHDDRRAEGRCVICGRAVCRECRRGDGRATLCAEHRGAVIIQGWVQVYTTTREFEAQLLRENLVAEGVDAMIFSQKDNMLSVDLGELSIVRVMVPVWEYEQARRVIREHMNTEGEVSFACPSCGEAYEPGRQSCAACGAVLAPGIAD